MKSSGLEIILKTGKIGAYLSEVKNGLRSLNFVFVFVFAYVKEMVTLDCLTATSTDFR